MKKHEQMPLLNIPDASSPKGWFTEALDAFCVSEKPGWPDAFGDALIKWNRENTRQPIRVLSLFSGAGGLDIGFHDVGFEVVECNEIEEAFAATLIENAKSGSRLEGSNIVCTDINQYEPKIENIDFIIGGPPCQTFSAAGARAAGVNGTDDERGNLFKQYVRILEKLQPRGFLFENVYRIVGAQGGGPWRQIQEAFQSLGYKLYWRILDAADYGVPQFRERLIIVGLKEGEFNFPYPTHGPDSPDQRGYYNASKAISGLKSNSSLPIIRGRHSHLLEGIPPGLNYSFYTERLKHPKPIFGWRSKFSDYLYKADPDTPVRTIKAQGGQYTGPFHWDNRVFSIEELKRLQTFPDNYLVIGNRQRVIHQLGNSVPPHFARILALSILQQVFNVKLPFKIELMPEKFKLGFRTRKSSLTNIYAKKAAKAIASLPKDENNMPYEGNEVFYGKITEGFRLQSVPSLEEADYFLEHQSHDGVWVLSYYENNDNKNDNKNVEFELNILPKKRLATDSGLKSITLRSFSTSRKSIIGLWKYLEKLLNQYAHKDDLVQLFGYYQYKQAYSISMTIFNSLISESLFWKVFEKVSRGQKVGEIINIDKLSNVYELPKEVLIDELWSSPRMLDKKMR